MNRHTVLIFLVALTCVVAVGCSGNGGNPLFPTPDQNLTASAETSGGSQTHLWGYYQIYINPETETVEAVVNRGAMFTANVVNFINKSPAGLGFKINGVKSGSGYTDIDIDISITHPFPGLPQYNGYDVRGVFMGDGSSQMLYNNDLVYPVAGTDQMMLADPVDGYGAPDGYTRWFNYTEFSLGGMPLFQYTPGKAAPKTFAGTATLNPYRYFANGLSETDNLWSWLNLHASQNGKFTSGATNSRNYYLRFPSGKGIIYGYAIIANWGGLEPVYHPSNAPEAVALNVINSSDVYYAAPNDKGGDIVLDISVWDWDSALTGTVMQDYTIFIESTVLSSFYKFNSSDMTPTGGDENYSTYHVEIPADNVPGTTGNEYWVIVEEQGEDYTNDFGVGNIADTDLLAACFRFPLTVSGDSQNTPPVIDGITDDIDPDGLNVEVNDSDAAVTYILLYTDPDLGQNHLIDWYIEDAGTGNPVGTPDAMPYDWSLKPLGDYEIWATIDDGYGVVTGGPWNVSKVENMIGWARTWGAGGQDRGYGTKVDSMGNIYVCGSFYYNVDFDPGSGEDFHNSGGDRDSFITKFDPQGNFLWARTWGGSVSFGGGATDLAVDKNDNVVISGYFYGTVDFDPGPEEDFHSAPGTSANCYLTKFSPDGNHLWAATWGSSHEYGDSALGVDTNANGDIYVSFGFRDTCDLDPGPGEDIAVAQGGYRELALSKFTADGNYIWGRYWGGPYDDYSFGCTVDKNQDVYIGGNFNNNCDFNPGPGEDWHNANTEGGSFISKFNPDGNFLFAKVFGGDCAFRIAVNSVNDVYVSGGFSGKCQFDPDGGTASITADGSRDCYVNVFDKNGAWKFVKTWDSIAIEDMTSGYRGYHITIDDEDNIYYTAHFTGSADLDPDPAIEDIRFADSNRDAFVSKFNPAFKKLWTNTFGGISTDDGGGIAVYNPNHTVYVTGWFFGQCDFDPGITEDIHISKGSLDAFLVKYYPDGGW